MYSPMHSSVPAQMGGGGDRGGEPAGFLPVDGARDTELPGLAQEWPLLFRSLAVATGAPVMVPSSGRPEGTCTAVGVGRKGWNSGWGDLGWNLGDLWLVSLCLWFNLLVWCLEGGKDAKKQGQTEGWRNPKQTYERNFAEM